MEGSFRRGKNPNGLQVSPEESQSAPLWSIFCPVRAARWPQVPMPAGAAQPLQSFPAHCHRPQAGVWTVSPDRPLWAAHRWARPPEKELGSPSSPRPCLCWLQGPRSSNRAAVPGSKPLTAASPPCHQSLLSHSCLLSKPLAPESLSRLNSASEWGDSKP